MAPRHRRPPRTNRWQRGTALVPLAVLGAAWVFTVSSPIDAQDIAGGPGSVDSAIPTVAYDPATASTVGIAATPDESTATTTEGSTTGAASTDVAPGPTSSADPGASTGGASDSGGPTSSSGGVTPPGAPGATSSPDPSGSRGSSRPTSTTTSAPSAPGTTGPVVQRLDNVAQATAYCAQHLPGSPTQEMITACGKKLVGATTDEAARLLSGTLVQVLTRLDLTSLIPAVPPVALPCLPIICV
ncbi:MAG: hypothetical protein WAK18_05565 [Nocardioidaceae bacterium]